MDLDFLFLEYDRGKAVAIVEYKHESAQPAYPAHPTYQAMIDLGNRADIPVFGVRYAADYSWYRVTPLNPKAKEHIPKRQEMDEAGWVAFLYQLRGYRVPISVIENLGVDI